ncbi:MAG TPA: alpha/beta fold hydrolase [Methylomirabilota bacterium]|jgi:polyhydroxyalkanoate synthase|nr:alpha/beta fold hydrolase [Methylomirabilota bacterium]
MLDPTASAETLKAISDEWLRNLRRTAKAVELMAHPAEPQIGLSPKTLVYRRNKARLYRYDGRRTRRVPVLFVPNLGISRPAIFDLQPGASFVEFMCGQGFDFFLLDWGVYGEEDNGLTVDECVTRLLPRVARQVLETAGTSELAVIGYCMGAPLSAAFVALHPDLPVRGFVNMAGPFDFSKAGLFARWLDKRFYDVDRVVDTVGAIPADWVRLGFKLLRPTMDVSTALNLWWNLDNDKYVEGYKALNRWANEYVPFPAEFFRQWVKDFYQENRLIRGELRLGGRRVDLGRLRCPVFAVAGAEDYIAPAPCVRALLDYVGTEDKTYLELPGGHISLIAGRAAFRHCWPRVAEWLAERST